jgi:hypothetical protein
MGRRETPCQGARTVCDRGAAPPALHPSSVRSLRRLAAIRIVGAPRWLCLRRRVDGTPRSGSLSRAGRDRARGAGDHGRGCRRAPHRHGRGLGEPARSPAGWRRCCWRSSSAAACGHAKPAGRRGANGQLHGGQEEHGSGLSVPLGLPAPAAGDAEHVRSLAATFIDPRAGRAQRLARFSRRQS